MSKTMIKSVLGFLIIMLIVTSSVFITALSSNAAPQEKINTNKISPEKAILIAVNAVPGVFQEVEIENEDGIMLYNVEIKDGQITREVKISFQGEIISIESEEDEEVAPEELRRINGIITEEQAIEIALGKVSGRVIEVETEREDGRLLYEIAIKDGSDITEVEIDAETGEILEIEREDDSDED